MRKKTSSSSGSAGRGAWQTVLPLTCLDCSFYWEVTLPGRLLRVKGKTWLIGYNGAVARLTRLVCPACGAPRVCTFERL